MLLIALPTSLLRWIHSPSSIILHLSSVQLSSIHPPSIIHHSLTSITHLHTIHPSFLYPSLHPPILLLYPSSTIHSTTHPSIKKAPTLGYVLDLALWTWVEPVSCSPSHGEWGHIQAIQIKFLYGQHEGKSYTWERPSNSGW